MGRSAAVSTDQFATFGELLKYLRRRVGLTQRELSIAVGYSEAHLSHLERNQRLPDPAALAARFVPALQIETEPHLAARLLELARAARRRTPPPQLASSAPAPWHNLPLQLTSFIGREGEVAQVAGLLSKSRIVTLTGAGGSGKTRLALRVAAMVAERAGEYSDGVWLVQLAALADPTLVAQTAATVLTVPEQPGRPLLTTLIDYLRTKQTLLALDNCEHLIEACAQLTETLLHTCPGLRILATSREAVGVPGEVAYYVPSLSLPAVSPQPSLDEYLRSEAIRLFADRAATARPGFALTVQNAPMVWQVCHDLDGIPLAIELAAARVRMLGVEQIAMRLNDLFGLLTTGERTAVPRHQTLGASIDWSYELLPVPERVMLHRLSVFAGGWTLEAAESVTSEPSGAPVTRRLPAAKVLDLLTALANKSLLVVEPAAEGESRYRLLEVIRQYAREKLIEDGTEAVKSLRHRHLAYYQSLAGQAWPLLLGANSVDWLNRLEQELDNLRAAIEWSVEGGAVEQGLSLTASLLWLWDTRHPREGRDRLDHLLAQPEVSAGSRARAEGLNAAGFLNWVLGSTTEGRTQLETAVLIGSELGLRDCLAWSLNWLGGVLTYQGEYSRARSLLEQSLAIHRELGDVPASMWPLVFLGNVALYSGDDREAQRLYEASLVTLRLSPKNVLLPMTVRRLAQALLHQADYLRARELCRESLTLNLLVGDRREMAACLACLGAELAARGLAIEAARLFGAVESGLESVPAVLLPYDRIQHERNVAAVRSGLDSASFEAAWAEGRAMPLEQSVDHALGP